MEADKENQDPSSEDVPIEEADETGDGGPASQPQENVDDKPEGEDMAVDTLPEEQQAVDQIKDPVIIPTKSSQEPTKTLQKADDQPPVLPASSMATYQKALGSCTLSNGYMGPRRIVGSRRGLASGASNQVATTLPSIAPSQAEIGRIPSADRDQRDVKTPKLSRENTRIRNVPNVVKMSSVAASAREPLETPRDLDFYQPSHYVDSVRGHRKVVGWDEATSSRPPLRIDMDGPTPWTYSPRNKPLNETNAPVWSFGRRSFVEKKGGARRSWEKAWFHTDDAWRMKTDFVDEVVWPTPMHYHQRPTLGPGQTTKHNYPSFSCGIRRTVDISKKGGIREPAPNAYDRDRADGLIYRRAPSFSHSFRRAGTTLWASGKDSSPGPGSYEPEVSRVMRHKPAFTIVGVRRDKEHELGPFATF